MRYNSQSSTPPALQDLESSPPSISFARNGTHLGMAFTLDEEKVKGRVFFPHVTTKNVVVKMNFCEVRNGTIFVIP